MDDKKIPARQVLKAFILYVLKRSGELSVDEVYEKVEKSFPWADKESLVDGDKYDTILRNRIRYAKLDLQNEGFVYSVRWGVWAAV
ncbi:hypothetical protein NSQ43_15820 [Sporosarcina sp. FSL W8-0480]|uniref:hypothetical protein n=1 Tax=Sporosarcina sp. FSL W8-0480 TaxID=2954701 RepID=UPI0030D9FB30